MQAKCTFAALSTEAVFAYYESGDEQLLTPVLAELRRSLDCYVEQRLAVYDDDARADLVQESLGALLRELRAKKFRGAIGDHGDRVGLLSYAKQLCRYRFLDERDRVVPSRPGSEENPFLTLADLSEESPVETLHYLPQAEAVLVAATEAVLGLEPKLRNVLVQVYFRGLNPQQAAAQLGLRVPTLLARLDAGLSCLRSWATGQPLRPTREVYSALRHLDTGDLFQEAACEPLRLAS